MEDSLAHIAIFVRVVQDGSFSAAADRLRVAKSTVSKRVAMLEERLGARLLHRTTRAMRLTEVGAAFYERCLVAVEAAEEAELAVTRLQASPRGTLRVSAPVSFGQRFLGPALRSLISEHLDVEVELVLDDRWVDVIDEAFDVALRIGKLPDSSLVAKKICDSRRIVVAAPSYIDAHGPVTHPNDLARHECLLYAYQRTGDAWSFERGGKAVTVPVRGRLRTNNGDVLTQAAVDGLGVAYLPDFLAQPDLAAGRLVALLDDHCQGEAPVHAVYPANRHLSAKVRVFVDLLVDHLAPPRPAPSRKPTPPKNKPAPKNEPAPSRKRTLPKKKR